VTSIRELEEFSKNFNSGMSNNEIERKLKSKISTGMVETDEAEAPLEEPSKQKEPIPDPATPINADNPQFSHFLK